MARSVVTTGFRFVVENAAGATASVEKINTAVGKMERTFFKSIGTGQKFGGAVANSMAAALPSVGALQLGMVGLAFTLAEKLLPLAGQIGTAVGKAALDFVGLTDEVEAATKSVDEFGLALYRSSGIDIGLGRYEEQFHKLNKAVEDGLKNVQEWRIALAAFDKEQHDKEVSNRVARIKQVIETYKQEQKEKKASLEAYASFAKEKEQAEWDTRDKNYQDFLARQAARDEERKAQAAEAEASYQNLLVMEWERTSNTIQAQLDEVTAKQTAVAQTQVILAQTYANALYIASDAMGQLVAATVLGNQDIAQSFLDMSGDIIRQVIQTVLRTIEIRAVEASANAFATSSSAAAILGPAGVALAAATASAFFGAALTYKGMVPQLATGGLITGGVPGRDSVPAMLQPGEFVIPAKETALMHAMMGRGGMGSGGTTIVINQMIPDSRATDRMIKDQLIPSQRRMARLGVRA